MSRFNIGYLASKAGAGGTITDEDVRILRDNFFNGDEIWPPEMRALFALLHKRLPASEAFTAFMVDAVSFYVVDELEPIGNVNEKNARWLIAMLRLGQDNWSNIDLAIVRGILDKVDKAPVALQQFALELAHSTMSGGQVWAGSDGGEVAGPACEPVSLHPPGNPAPARTSVAA
jgi:hypothetical protein